MTTQERRRRRKELIEVATAFATGHERRTTKDAASAAEALIHECDMLMDAAHGTVVHAPKNEGHHKKA